MGLLEKAGKKKEEINIHSNAISGFNKSRKTIAASD